MKKLNVICAAVAVFVGVSAHAGSISSVTTGGTRFAQEIFGAGSDASTTVRPEAFTYTILTTNGVVINPNGIIYLTIRLAGGSFQNSSGAATLPAGVVDGSALTIVNQVGTVGTGVVSSDGSTVTYPITYTNGVTLGAGSTLRFTAAVGDIRNVKNTLGTVGGVVSATVGLSSLLASATPNVANPVPADIDGPVAVAVNIAQSVNGVTVATSPTGAVSSTGVVQKIDLTVTPPNTVYTAVTNGTTAIAKLGEVRVTLPSTPARLPAGTSGAVLDAATYAGSGASLAITATPNAGRTFPFVSTGTPTAPIATVFAVSGADCAGTIVGTTATLTPVTAAAAVTVTVPAAALATAMGAASPNTGLISLCQGTANGGTISPITPTLTAVATPATALTNFATDTGTGPGFALDLNGQLVDVTTYWPGVLASADYLGYLRITNTGTVAAPVTAQHIAPAGSSTGISLVGSPVVIISSLAAGQSVLLSTAAIDGAIGAAPSGFTAGRLRVTAPTNGLRVQSLLQVGTGTNAPIEYTQVNPATP